MLRRVGPELVGRGEELDALSGALTRARGGQGSAWALTGEPGIGKSELALRVADEARAKGFRVLFGRCWEVGGAPTHWPWIQALRGLGLDPEALAGRAPILTRLLPELATPERADVHGDASLTAAEARFLLLDAVCRTLADAARQEPLLVVIEDLHASDASSILQLELLASTAPTLPLVALATWRDRELRLPDPSLLRGLRRLPLARLGRDEVARFLAGEDEAFVQQVWERTEGHPLYLDEVVRWLRRGSSSGSPSPSRVPPSVGAAYLAAFDALADEHREIVALAAACGREVGSRWLVRTHTSLTGPSGDGAGVARVEDALAAAAERGLGAATPEGRWVFRHVLARDAIYEATPPAQRERLHAAIASALEAEGGTRAEVAHHWLRAGAREAPRVVRAAREAAEEAAGRHAPEEALRWLKEVDLHEVEDPSARLWAAELCVRIGALEQGRARALALLDDARARGDAACFARAALVVGAALHYAEVDPALVAVLREARERLGDTSSSLAVAVLARLASAMQPSLDPEAPMVLAREAITRARALGDERLLLETLGSAVAAMMDLAPPAERLALNREQVALARRLEDLGAEHQGWRRLFFDAHELGDAALAREACEEVARVAARIGLPHHAWVARALESVELDRVGAFESAERAAEAAMALATRAGDPNARRATSLQAIVRAIRRGRFAEAEARSAALAASGAEGFHRDMAELLGFVASARSAVIASGVGAWAAPAHAPEVFARALAFADRSLWHLVAELAFASADRGLAAELAEKLVAHEALFVSFGAYAMAVGGPIARDLALVRWVLGERELARRGLARAEARALAAGARVEAAWIALERALLDVEEGDPSAAERLEAAARRARDLGVELPETRRGAPREPIRPREASRRWSLARDGELWRVTHAGHSFLLADTKGMRLLAQLVGEPGRERHVLDLASETGARAPGSAGDAGEILDGRARAAYAARARALRERLEDAEERADLGASERAREELEALEAELRRALGLGGRTRAAGATVERARVNVQRRLRDATRRIGEQDPALGRHLERSLRTGVLCVYEPD
ncbi:MAG: AAA family ATPase [Myxococcales bacterium]|nr:AAA family ATPase [Myxococcales bacterium]